MLKRIFAALCAASLVLSFTACRYNMEEKEISGVSFDPTEYDTASYARYENKLYGIIIEYPESYERIGNFDLDGYITFEGSGNVISVYVPDAENEDILTPEEYVDDVLELDYDDELSYTTKYGKTGGFKAVTTEEGRIRTDFIIKGIDGFYRFAYETDEAGFTEEDIVFQTVMSSIRVDDGVYNKLSRMANRYTVLLEYIMNMKYITDANYANHCLNNFEGTNDTRHKNDALTTSVQIRNELGKIITHEREEDEGYETQWKAILAEAEKISAACERAEACIANGDIAGAQKIFRTEFTYTLSTNASSFISVINAELSDY